MSYKNSNRFSKKSFRYILIFIVIVFCSYTVVSGQERKQEAPPLKERIFFGGSFGLQFGTITNINVSPVVGLWVMPRVAVAIGPEYIYYHDPYYKTSIWGGKAYTEFVLVRDLNNIVPVGIHLGLILHAEIESLSLESEVWNQNPAITSGRFLANTALAGGGISQQLGTRSSLNFIVLWVVGGSGYNYYSNPEIRISFNF